MKTGLMAAGIALLCAMGLAFASFAGPSTDVDGDTVFDVLDNCLNIKNAAPLDCDTDNDGYGNVCDGDFDQNKAVNANDFNLRFVPDFKLGLDKGIQDGTDMDCNGSVNANDFNVRFVPQFKAGVPGKSGLFCAGTVPCDL
jgi:hypothetical protein